MSRPSTCKAKEAVKRARHLYQFNVRFCAAKFGTSRPEKSLEKRFEPEHPAIGVYV